MGSINDFTTGKGYECEAQDIAVTADMNNVAVTSTVVRLTPDNAWNITGLDGSAFPFDTANDSAFVFLVNADSANTVTLKHNSGSSSAGNKIFVSNNADKTLPPYATLFLTYQNVSGREGWWVNA